MSKQPPPPSTGKSRPRQRKGRAVARGSKRQTDKTLMIVAGGVVLVGIALVIAFGDNKTNGPDFPPGDGKASASVVNTVTAIDTKLLDAVGQGSVPVPSLPKKLPGPVLTKDGKPRVIYLGAEYCPYCAAERWSIVQALSRFGTFDNLRFTSSAKVTTGGNPEVFPGTQTFSFHNTKYTSKYITFESVEQKDNSYKDLEAPTTEQADLAKKYDAPPYVESNNAGSIPFIDFANEFMISGGSYDAGVLKDKTHAEIADAMTNSGSDISQGAVGAANAITAAICMTTDNKPAHVCSVKAVKDIAAKLD